MKHLGIIGTYIFIVGLVVEVIFIGLGLFGFSIKILNTYFDFAINSPTLIIDKRLLIFLPLVLTLIVYFLKKHKLIFKDKS